MTISQGEAFLTQDEGQLNQTESFLETGNVSRATQKTLDARVAAVSPALYAAGARSNLTREERNLIENWSKVKDTHEKLMRMKNKDAASAYEKLDPDFQLVLKTYYNIDYANKPGNDTRIDNPTYRKLLGLDNGLSLGDVVKSPFRFLFAAAEQYGNYINTPYSMAQNAAVNREDFWSRKNADDAFDGNFLYDNSVVKPLVDKYGGATSFVAMHLLAGKTPGEIIDSWGPNDAEILKAINQVYEEPEAFSNLLDEFSNAQLSPGRDRARWLFKKFDLDPNENKIWFKLTSGSMDLAFQIFADPLTYLTFGGSAVIRGAGKAGKLAEAISNGRSVVEHLSDPAVARFFTGYADNIGKYTDAIDSGDLKKAAETKSYIQKNFAEHGTDEEIEFWSSAGIKDFDSFKAQFIDPKTGEEVATNFSKLIRGLTSNTTYAREGAAFSRQTRNITLGAKQKITEVFTGKVKYEDLDATPIQKLFKEMENAGLDRSGTFDYTDIDNIIRTSADKSFRKKIEKLAQIHPGNKVVYVDDAKVSKTLDVVRRQAYMAMEDKRLAEMFVAHFKTSSMSSRIALKKSLDEMTMRRYGLHGTPNGQEKINQILGQRYGTENTFGSAEKMTYPGQSGIDQAADSSILGPILPYQFKDGITALPWRDIHETIASTKVRKDSDSLLEYIPNLIGGAYYHKATRMLMDTWSLLTLVPLLGIRTAIDEGFMFAMYAKGGMAKDFIQAKRAGNVLAAYTADNAATGIYKSGLQHVLGKITGREFGAVNAFGPEIREQVFKKYTGKIGSGLTPYEAERAARNELFDMALAKYGKRLPEEYKQWLKESAELNPNILKDTSSSNIVDSLMQRQAIFTTNKSLLSKSQLDQALEDRGMFASGIFDEVNPMDADIQLHMFRNFWSGFGSDTFNFGGKKLEQANPAWQFIKNNGLKTKEDWNNAVDGFLKAIGFEFNGKIWQISNKKYGDVQEFLSSTTHMSKFDGLPDVEKARGFINDAFADLYHRFHGGADQYNDKLMNVFQDFITGKSNSYRKALNDLTFDDYMDLTKGNLPKDRIFSDLDFTLSTDLPTWISKFGMNNLFDAMSRQTDDILRQPVVHTHYFTFRKQYKAFEDNYAKNIADKMRYNDPTLSPRFVEEESKRIASRFFSQKAMDDAAHHVLKYSDNPEIRTVFAYNMRTIGRFYRAVEDFHRRMYRLTRDHGLGTIYRLRLMNQGMAANGAIHRDEDGEEYAILPFDDVIFGAVNTTTRILTGEQVSVNQPLFNNFTFKLTGANPSFQTDAGMPYLSGPVGSLSVLAVKSLLGKFDPTKNLAEDIDTAFLGSLGDNVTIRSAVVPRLVNNIWKVLSPDERSAEEVSAYTQALSYYQANGYGINPEDYIDPVTGELDQARLDRDKRDYLANVRISAHNIITMRSILGMIFPASLQLSNSKDVPDYLKNVGVTSLNSSFYNTLDQIRQKYPDVEDHYELALATWMGDNPGKVAYIVSPNDATVKPIIKYTNDMQDWAVKNLEEIKQYGAGALIFAPNTGEFNPGVWKWATAAGITSKIPANQTTEEYINNFYDKVMLQQHANAYYALTDEEEEILRGIPFSMVAERRSVLKQFEKKRKSLILAVPGLENYIRSGTDNSDAADFVESAHNYVNSKDADVSKDVADKINKVYDLYTDFASYANEVDLRDLSNKADLKRVKKQQVIDEIQKLIDADSTRAVEQYFKYGVLKLMSAKSRDVTATIERNVVK